MAKRTTPLAEKLFYPAAFFGGLLVGLPHMFAALAPAQALGLGLLFWIFFATKPDAGRAVAGGLLFGIAMATVRVPLNAFTPMATVFFFGLAILLGLLIVLPLGKFCRLPPLRGALGWAASVALIDFLHVTFIAPFGTAQALGLPWVSYPALSSFVALWGWASLALFCTGLGALVALLFFKDARKRALAALLAWLVVFSGAGFLYRLSAETGKTVLAHAVGFWSMPLPREVLEAVQKLGTDMDTLPVVEDTPVFSKKLAQGKEAFLPDKKNTGTAPDAELWVYPEFAFQETRNDYTFLLFEKMRSRLKANELVAAPWFDIGLGRNSLSYLSREKQGQAYTKRHLVPHIEKYNRGAGIPVLEERNGISFGALICHDDNFTEIANALSARGVQVVAIPIMDWAGVEKIHPLSAVLRAMEGRYAVVRAAACSQVAIIRATGQYAARISAGELKEQGQAVLTAQIPAGKSRSLYSWWGDIPFLLTGLITVCVVFIPKRKPPQNTR